MSDDKLVRQVIAATGAGSSLRAHDPNGEREGVITDPRHFRDVSASTQILCKDIMAKLATAFPGFRWAVQPVEIGKVFNIFCLDFSGTWGYVIRYPDIVHDARRRAALDAGGSILRRFRYPANRYQVDLMQAIPRRANGEAIPDTSDMPANRHTLSNRIDHAIATGTANITTDAHGRKIVGVS